ncbi:hypothetical protein HN011_009712 [Eciton burchellii]|nr:hypothetical protein HN011_009712 [Eciton burchellii]
MGAAGPFRMARRSIAEMINADKFLETDRTQLLSDRPRKYLQNSLWLDCTVHQRRRQNFASEERYCRHIVPTNRTRRFRSNSVLEYEFISILRSDLSKLNLGCPGARYHPFPLRDHVARTRSYKCVATR